MTSSSVSGEDIVSSRCDNIISVHEVITSTEVRVDNILWGYDVITSTQVPVGDNIISGQGVITSSQVRGDNILSGANILFSQPNTYIQHQLAIWGICIFYMWCFMLEYIVINVTFRSQITNYAPRLLSALWLLACHGFHICTLTFNLI